MASTAGHQIHAFTVLLTWELVTTESLHTPVLPPAALRAALAASRRACQTGSPSCALQWSSGLSPSPHRAPQGAGLSHTRQKQLGQVEAWGVSLNRRVAHCTNRGVQTSEMLWISCAGGVARHCEGCACIVQDQAAFGLMLST